MSTAELLSLFEASLAQAMMPQRTFRGDDVQTRPPALPSTTLEPGSAVRMTGGMAPLFNNGRVIQRGDADRQQAQWRALMGEGVGYPGDAQNGSAGSFHCLLGRETRFLPAGSSALAPDEKPPPAFLVPLPSFTRGPPRAHHVMEEALQLPEGHFDRAAATSHGSRRSSGTGAGSPAGGEGASSSGGTTAATAPSSGGAAHPGAGASNGRRLLCTFVFVGFDPVGHRDFELVPRLIGRSGANMRDIAKACEGKVRVRGRGSGHLEQHSGFAGAKEADVPLQIALSSKDRINFETGRQRLVDLLDFVTVHFERYCRKKGIVPTPLLYTVGTGSD